MESTTCYRVTVKTTNSGGGTFVAHEPETNREIYCDCENGVFYYCGEFQDIHKFLPESEILKIERMGISYT